MFKKIKFIFTILVFLFSLFFYECEKESKLPTDGDGNEYDTVVIGTQVWLIENLKTTKFNNGISIPSVTDATQWATKTSPAFCWYDNQSESYKDEYGALYNWWAIQVSSLCPEGYHVPSKEEWITLIEYLGGREVAGGKLKMTGNIFWENNSFATNESGFSAVGGGFRNHNDGTFTSLRLNGSWWTKSLGINEENGDRLIIYNVFGEADHGGGVNKKEGISVRCLKDHD